MQITIPSKKIVINSSALTLARGIAFITGAVNTILTAGSLGAGGFADFATIFAILGIIAIVNEFGLDPLYISFVAETDNKRRNEFLRQFFYARLLLGGIFLIIVSLISIFFPFNPSIRLGLMLASPIYILTYLTSIIVSYFQSKLIVIPTSVIEVIGKTTITSLIILFSFTHLLNLQTVLISHILGNLVIFLGTLWLLFATGFEKKIESIKLNVLKNIIKLAIPLAITSFLNQVFFRIDIPILSQLRSGEEVGWYAFAYKIYELAAYPAAFLTISFYPIMSSLYQNEQFSYILKKSTLILLAISVIISLAVVSLFPLFVSIIPELSKYAQSGKYITILFLSLPFLYLQTLYAPLFILKNWQRKLALIYAFVAAVNISLNFLFIPYFGAIGAAFTTLLTQTIVAIILIWHYRFNLFSLTQRNTI